MGNQPSEVVPMLDPLKSLICSIKGHARLHLQGWKYHDGKLHDYKYECCRVDWDGSLLLHRNLSVLALGSCSLAQEDPHYCRYAVRCSRSGLLAAETRLKPMSETSNEHRSLVCHGPKWWTSEFGGDKRSTIFVDAIVRPDHGLVNSIRPGD